MSRLQFLTVMLAGLVGLLPRSVKAKLLRGGSSYFSFTMQGVSMEPTIRNDQIVQVNATAYRYRRPQRGDLIVFRAVPAGQPDRSFLKRIVGLPGEVVAVRGGRVYINGRALSEPYVRVRAYYTYPPRRVPANGYFVLGDNRNNSFDSSKWPDPWLQRRYIVGKVMP